MRKYYKYDNKELTLLEISKIVQIPKTTLRSRMFKYNLDVNQAINFKSSKPTIPNGSVFGNLTVLDRIKGDGNAKYKCLCKCGHTAVILGLVLKKGKLSCNNQDCKFSKLKKHNLSKTREYKIWVGIKARCLNPKNPSYPYYGGIGVTISEEFKNNFLSFYNHVGNAPSLKHSIDRIDNSKGYEKDNLRWSTKKEQSNNVRKVNDLTLEIFRLRKLLDDNKIKY